LDQATFARFRGELRVVFPFWALVGRVVVHMHMKFHVCIISCLHLNLCIISCLHLCIIDCMCIICHRDVLLSYALITMICYIWGNDFACDAHEMYNCALRSFGIYLWMPFFCKNAIWSSLLSRLPLMFKLGAYGYILLNLCLEPFSFHLGSKIH
jgi:hypothetical protein